MHPRCLVVMPTKDEGAFLLESIAWYRALGFEMLIPTNSCTDSSPQLLNLLQSYGVVHHAPHTPRETNHPKLSGYGAAYKHPVIDEVDWVLVCDVDEFLIIHTAPSIQAFLRTVDAHTFICMGINWRVFGSSGHDHYEDALVHRRFIMASPYSFGANAWHKTLFRQPKQFKRFGDHSPLGYNGTWGEGDAHFVNSDGLRLDYMSPNSKRSNRIMHAGDKAHTKLQINHYAVRSLDDMIMKKGTKSPSSGKDRYTDDFFARLNRNDQLDRSAIIRNPGFAEEYARISAIPGVMLLHHLCCAQRVDRLSKRAGFDVSEDNRYRHHMQIVTQLMKQYPGRKSG